jgi:hypothetical protein
MNTLPAMASGAVGAIALNLIHESARHILPQAPQVQEVAMRAIARSMRGLGKHPPGRKTLYRWATAGDLVSNALYYSMIGVGRTKHPWARGAALGLLGGIGAVALPGPLGLGSKLVARTPATKAMTIAWYTLGGLAAAAAFDALRRRA